MVLISWHRPGQLPSEQNWVMAGPPDDFLGHLCNALCIPQISFWICAFVRRLFVPRNMGDRYEQV